MIPDCIPIKSPQPDKVKRILSSFGYFLGRWIYLIDAADDYDKDRRRHDFNPFLTMTDDRVKMTQLALPALNHALSEALLSYGLLDAGRFDAVILNSLNRSCVIIQHQILARYQPQTERSST